MAAGTQTIRRKPVTVKVIGRGGHLTTRAHNRHLVYHAPTDTWYAFVGTARAIVKKAPGANALFTSSDGAAWRLRHVFCRGYGTSSSQDALLAGDTIYLLHWPNDWQKWDQRYGGTPGEYPVHYKVRAYTPGKAAGGRLTFRDHTAIRCTNHQLHFYGSIAHGTDGYLWVGSRFYDKAVERATMACITRSARPDDPSAWLEPVEIGRRRGNSVAPDLSPLPNGRMIAINHYSPFSAKSGKAVIAAATCDPGKGKWSAETAVALGNAARRLRGLAEFDPGSGRLHLVYPDRRGDIRHKILSAPYRRGDWSPKAGVDVPGRLVARGTDDDLSIALDGSRSPATIALVYRRGRTVYRKDYDGANWSAEERPIVRLADAEGSTELSLNLDGSKKLGLLFLDTDGARGRTIKFLRLPRRRYAHGR